MLYQVTKVWHDIRALLPVQSPPLPSPSVTQPPYTSLTSTNVSFRNLSPSLHHVTPIGSLGCQLEHSSSRITHLAPQAGFRALLWVPQPCAFRTSTTLRPLSASLCLLPSPGKARPTLIVLFAIALPAPKMVPDIVGAQ